MKSCLPGLILLPLLLLNASARTAEFDLHKSQVYVRLVQACVQCGQALDVTEYTPGTAIQCPRCKTVQLRRRDDETTRQHYQVCPACRNAIDVTGFTAGTRVVCGACHRPQTVFFVTLPNAALPDLSRFRQEAEPEADEAPDPEPPPRSAAQLKVAATVDGDPILGQAVERRALLLYEARKEELGTAVHTPAGHRRLADAMPDLRRQALEMLIREYLLARAARAEGVTVEEKRLDEALAHLQRQTGMATADAETRREVSMRLLFDAMRERHTTERPPTVDAVRAHYETHRAAFTAPPRLRLRVLTVWQDRSNRNRAEPAAELAGRAQALLEQTRNFAAAVVEYSEDIFAPHQGRFRPGTTDWVSAEDLAAPVRRAVERAEPGAVVGPFDLVSALCLVELQAREGGAPLPLEAVQERIQAELTEQQRQRDFEAYLDTLRAQAKVVVY